MRKVLILILVLSFFGIGCQKQEVIEETVISKEETDSKVDIINLNSKSRPYAVVINNSTAAVKVQTGLQEAYLTYEIPVEGGLTRLLAFYKDKHDIKIGTIRSARHNFLDYVFENDAIFICYGWSHYAKDDMTSINLDYMNGVVHSGSFWRENPENLASEHTAYTSLAKVIEFSKNKNFTLTTEKGNVFQYSPIDIDLSHNVEVSKANTIRIPSNDFSNTTYVYDEENKIYKGQKLCEPESFLKEYHFKLIPLYEKFYIEEAFEIAQKRKAMTTMFYNELLDEISIGDLQKLLNLKS